MDAWVSLQKTHPGVGLLAITSPDLLHREWRRIEIARAAGTAVARSHIETLLRPLGRHAQLVTVLDGSPSALSWIGAVTGALIRPLGIDRFGQTGSLPDLYNAYNLSAQAISRSAEDLFAIAAASRS